MTELTVSGIVKQGFAIGIKNLASLLLAAILWVLTIWIPYLNVGTTIGIVSIIVAMSKGTVVSPLTIFDAKYRKYIGEFFLVLAFVQIGTMIGFVFMVIPGIVISIAWGQAIYLLVDKEMTPMEAIKVSNQITYGKKWTIVLGTLLIGIVLVIIIYILGFIGGLIGETVGAVLSFIGAVAFLPIVMGAYAHIYGVLTEQLGPAV